MGRKGSRKQVVYRPTPDLLKQFVKLCNAQDVQDAIRYEVNPQPVRGISEREELARYADRNDGEDDPQLETKLADYKECLAAFQKMARQVAENKPLSFIGDEYLKLNDLLGFKIPPPKIMPTPNTENPDLFEVGYLPYFMPKGVKFPVLSACTLFLCYIADKSVPYHLAICEGVKAIRCGKILLRKRRQKSGVKTLCRSHQTLKAKRKKKRS